MNDTASVEMALMRDALSHLNIAAEALSAIEEDDANLYRNRVRLSAIFTTKAALEIEELLTAHDTEADPIEAGEYEGCAE
ncbi:hypothetical protein V7F95_08170 [Cutibacterium avidum]|uniref:hypothetical protein n=1 Tax=Cutibacterium avidum TaxID=33010 RepID=UPI002FEFCD54